jgi:hypothetical protein
VTYDPDSDRYTLPDEHALALADEDSPFYILGVYDWIASLYADEDQILEAFRSGRGMGWHEHDHRLFRGTERFFRPGYRVHLVAEWIPALEGVQEKLERGAKVADVGCAHGASTIIMAAAFPNSEFPASTTTMHPSSAREAARDAGVEDRIQRRLPRRSVSRSGRRRARLGSPRCSSRAGSRACVAPRKRRLTSSSRQDRSGGAR